MVKKIVFLIIAIIITVLFKEEITNIVRIIAEYFIKS